MTRCDNALQEASFANLLCYLTIKRLAQYDMKTNRGYPQPLT